MSNTANNNTNQITFYGAAWCEDCRVAKPVLDEYNIPYNYIDLELVESAAAEVEEINNGLQSIPTIIFPDGQVVVEPTRDELIAILKEQKLI